MIMYSNCKYSLLCSSLSGLSLHRSLACHNLPEEAFFFYIVYYCNWYLEGFLKLYLVQMQQLTCESCYTLKDSSWILHLLLVRSGYNSRFWFIWLKTRYTSIYSVDPFWEECWIFSFGWKRKQCFLFVLLTL